MLSPWSWKLIKNKAELWRKAQSAFSKRDATLVFSTSAFPHISRTN